ncbi:MAG TPA: VOC family protein [Flavobacteriales bacterium]|nr:VOC family protein [Flavobacteriales bacterium]
MPTQIFVNMQVRDLPRSRTFFEKIGYAFNPQFSDDNAACLVISDTIYAMLLTPKSMASFLPSGKTAADATTTTEVLIALSFDSREAVNAIYDKAMNAGATQARPTDDQGFMYGRSFNDLDGHIWEVFWFDPKAIQG